MYNSSKRARSEKEKMLSREAFKKLCRHQNLTLAEFKILFRKSASTYYRWKKMHKELEAKERCMLQQSFVRKDNTPFATIQLPNGTLVILCGDYDKTLIRNLAIA